MERKSSFDNEDRLIHTFLNSSLDARVIDFVRRDALHLGIVSGESFDLQELLPHFTIHNHRLALRVTGIAVAEQIISLRYWLFQRIYWNRPNRAYCSMVRHVIMQLDKHDNFSNLFRKIVLDRNQNDLLAYLLEYSEKYDLSKPLDICRRLVPEEQDLYKTILDISRQDRPDYMSSCEMVSKMDYYQLYELETLLEDHLKGELKSVDGLDSIKLLIIDMPYEPGSKKLGEDMTVIRSDVATTTLLEFSGIIAGINASFESHLSRLRVYMHPKFYPKEVEERKKIEEIILRFISDHAH